MTLTELSFSAIAVVFGVMFIVIGFSYLSYRLKNKSPYDIRSN